MAFIGTILIFVGWFLSASAGTALERYQDDKAIGLWITFASLFCVITGYAFLTQF